MKKSMAASSARLLVKPCSHNRAAIEIAAAISRLIEAHVVRDNRKGDKT